MDLPAQHSSSAASQPRQAAWRAAVDRHLSQPGLLVATLFFALSLTPSLLPRTAVVQGLLSGAVFAAGYGLGVFLQWIWDYTELRLPLGRYRRLTIWLAALIGIAFVITSLAQTSGWQNSVRAAMGVEPVETGHPFQVLLVALLPAILLIVLGSVLVHAVRLMSRQLTRFLPRRVALVLSLVLVGLATGVLVNGVLLRFALQAADSFFEQLDRVTPQAGGRPAEPLQSGSAQSLIAWDTIGRDGRIYVESGPSQADIAGVIGRPAQTPLRVYVGMRSAPSLEERVQLALAEMLRVGAFDRSVLVVIMPVGTGWVDPPGIDSLEYLLAGNVASVALQYSYLTSPLSLVIEPDYGADAAMALFSTVYAYWTTLPRAARPKLYLNGLSLGAHSSQASAQLLDLLGDPYDGALWVGPPFSSQIWRWATNHRKPASPEWLPVFGNSSAIRFANRGSQLDEPAGPWGPLRIAFLQYPSDPIVFFDWSILYHPPSWLNAPRGPGVSEALTWYPVVTLFQLGMDMALAPTSPIGYGHIYAFDDYLDAWRALIDPPGWDDAGIAALKSSFVTIPADSTWSVP